MNKRITIVWVLSLIAFSALMSAIHINCGVGVFAKVLIPAAIIFGLIWKSIIVYTKKQ